MGLGEITGTSLMYVIFGRYTFAKQVSMYLSIINYLCCICTFFQYGEHRLMHFSASFFSVINDIYYHKNFVPIQYLSASKENILLSLQNQMVHNNYVD